MDPNRIMVPGVDSVDIPRELLEIVKASKREALTLAEVLVDDVWVHLHGEHRDDAGIGFAFPSLQRKSIRYIYRRSYSTPCGHPT